MDIERNKKIIARLYKDVFQEWNTTLFDEMISVDFQDHLLNGPEQNATRGPDVMHQLYTFLRSAFADLCFDVQDIMAENDKVMVRWSFSGTHDGDLAGVLPTGQAIKV